jgi:hypothetical protein
VRAGFFALVLGVVFTGFLRIAVTARTTFRNDEVRPREWLAQRLDSPEGQSEPAS